MTRAALCGAVLSAALAVGVSAQTGTGMQQDKQSAKPGTVTVTGCLALADSASTGATGTSGASSRVENYVLKNVSPSPTGSEPSATGTSGSSIASQYALTGGNKSDLKKYENSKVEIRGRIEDSKAPKSSGSGAASGAASGPEMPRLHIDSVRQISASCSN